MGVFCTQYRSLRVLIWLNNHKTQARSASSCTIIGRKALPLQSDFGERLRIPVSQCVNSGVFGRMWWFVNRWFESPEGESPPRERALD